MRIRNAVFIAVFCLLLGGMLTPIISPSAKSGRGSSCKNPYRTSGVNGSEGGNEVVRINFREKNLDRPGYFRFTLKVTPKRNIRLCRAKITLQNRTFLYKDLPSRGGVKVWEMDTSDGRGIRIITVYSRKK